MAFRGKIGLAIAGAALFVLVALVLQITGREEEQPQVLVKTGEVERPVPGETVQRGEAASVVMETNLGSFTVDLDSSGSPVASDNFGYLAKSGFYDGLGFHRIVPGFVIQGGDPEGDGTGGPGYSVIDRPAESTVYTPGTVAMAKSGGEPRGASGSQFFIVTADRPLDLPPDYAVVGRVSNGFGVIEEIGKLGGPDESPTTTVVIEREGIVLMGSTEGEGAPVVLCHGLSANRDSVVHGSRRIPRSGRKLILWDARGHGESDPAPPGRGYGYPEQVGDLGAIVDQMAGDRPIVVGGHSMGCHTAVAWTLDNPERVQALLLIGPVFGGPTDEARDRWDARAKALEEGGPEAFAARAAAEYVGEEEGRSLIERLALERARRHRHPEAVAEALRQVPRSKPFGELSDLGSISSPVLVVGSRDELDPGHPLSTAVDWADTIPGAELIVEEEGEHPLAWQGGVLSRRINAFLDRVTTPAGVES